MKSLKFVGLVAVLFSTKSMLVRADSVGMASAAAAMAANAAPYTSTGYTMSLDKMTNMLIQNTDRTTGEVCSWWEYLAKVYIEVEDLANAERLMFKLNNKRRELPALSQAVSENVIKT